MSQTSLTRKKLIILIVVLGFGSLITAGYLLKRETLCEFSVDVWPTAGSAKNVIHIARGHGPNIKSRVVQFNETKSEEIGALDDLGFWKAVELRSRGTSFNFRLFKPKFQLYSSGFNYKPPMTKLEYNFEPAEVHKIHEFGTHELMRYQNGDGDLIVLSLTIEVDPDPPDNVLMR
ncbi:MAG: hypothetical protein KDA65_12265 [Planctomycetaceae bacterium]|nr:hypothetical protein [Planctomycetaceae bacterium]